MGITLRRGGLRDAPNRECRDINPSRWTLHVQTHKHRYTREEVVLSTMDQLPLPPGAQASTPRPFGTRVPNAATNLSDGTLRAPPGRGQRVSSGGVGGEEGVKERLLHIVSVNTRVAISRWASCFKLQLRDYKEATRSWAGGGRPTPMAWGWSLDAALDLRVEIRRACMTKGRSEDNK